MKLNEAIGIRMENILNERGLTAYKIAKLGGFPKQVIYSVINHEYKKISVDTVFQFVATLNMSLAEFFSDPVFSEISD